MTIKDNLKAVLGNIIPEARLVAVSKYHPAESIRQCYECGQRIFGESHEQELRVKVPVLPNDIEWHFIGHLQTNKVKYIAPYISMIHTVDSLRLLREIEKQASKHNRIINVLLELHIAQEESKYGLSLNECRELLENGEWKSMEHIHISGLMTMASYTEDEQQIRREFTIAQDFFEEIKNKYFHDDESFKEKSWGMSDDYMIAQQCGATMVRIGTSIFGERQY